VDFTSKDKTSMTGEHKVSATRYPLKILAVFALAFTLQGVNLALFQGSRHEQLAKLADPESRCAVVATIRATSTISVTSAGSCGPGSLLNAIADANVTAGLNEIKFLFAEPITITVTESLIIRDSVSIEAHGTGPGWVTLDATHVTGNVLVVSDAPGTSLRRLRVTNAGGFGIHVTGVSGGTEIISNTIDTGSNGILLDNTSNITVTHNVLLNLVETAVTVNKSSHLRLIGNRMLAGDAGIDLYGGVSDAIIFSNTVFGVLNAGTVGIRAAGFPASIGIQMRNNFFTDTGTQISFGPNVNGGFPAPEIIGAQTSITSTATVKFSALSTADPFSYTYPLSMDVYRVRSGSYVPLGESVLYEAGYFPDAFSYTMSGVDLLETDQLALIATTANPSSSEFSPAVEVTPAPFDGATLWVKAFFEGPYSVQTHMMAGDLVDAGVLPLSQPFSNQAYNGTVLDFDGSQSVTHHPDSVIDWLLVNLRTGQDSASTIAAATHAALISEHGTVATPGWDSLQFAGVADGSYYLVLRSRNHLDIISDSAIVISGGGGRHDFTRSESSALGTNSQVNLEANVWGMFAGDGSVDGQVTAIDFNDWLVATKAVATGYEQSDFNFDESVTAIDFNLWLVNTKMVASSKVP
jgi:parallel beta-helix repeat protein